MTDVFWTNLSSGITGLMSACVGASYTLRIQSRREGKKDQVKQIGEKTLYVEATAIKRDKNGYYIPGRGRIELEEQALLQAKKNRLALLCHECSGLGDEVPIYQVGRKVPI